MTERRHEQIEIRPESIEMIRELLSPEIVKEKEFLWQDILAAIEDITKTKTAEGEELLVDLLGFEGQIRLVPESDIPGFMSPGNMLKFLAIQFLIKWTGRKYLDAFERISTTTESPALSDVTEALIESLNREL